MKDILQEKQALATTPAAQREAREGGGGLSAALRVSERQYVQRRLVAQVQPAPGQAAFSPPVQRAVNNMGGNTTHSRNVATAWKGGGSYADTPSIFNHHEIPPSRNKEGMLHEPQLVNVGQDWMTRPATQQVSWRMELPSAGPWIHHQMTSLEELDAFAKEGGWRTPQRSQQELSLPFTLRVEGFPSNEALEQSIERHEQHHIDEQDDVVDHLLRPWDTEINDNQATAKDPLNAASRYEELGIAKAQPIADQIVQELQREGIEYHHTEQGKEPEITDVVADSKTQVYTVRLKGRA